MRSTPPTGRTALFALALAFIASGCNLSETSPTSPALPAPNASVSDATARAAAGGTFWGPAVPIGRGIARTFVSLDGDGAPVSTGVDLSAQALATLPDEPRALVLRFHPAGALPYTHVLMDWNPAGHEPPGVYDSPHFDFHFYFSSLAERLAIGPNDAAEFANAPDPKYIPADYLQTPGGVPQMGAHWVDLMAPEFNGGVFSRTFIFGTYDGTVTFIEPMITLAVLQSATDESIAVRQPQAWERDGYYPASYRIQSLDRAGGVRVSLDDLQWRDGE